MNQWFLAIVVKIRAPIFTIPMRFADLLRRAAGGERADASQHSRCASVLFVGV
jgi:hypothetical protein